MVGFRRRCPEVKEQSLRAHIRGATENVPVESRGAFSKRQRRIARIAHGQYCRFEQDAYALQPRPISKASRVVVH